MREGLEKYKKEIEADIVRLETIIADRKAQGIQGIGILDGKLDDKRDFLRLINILLLDK